MIFGETYKQEAARLEAHALRDNTPRRVFAWSAVELKDGRWAWLRFVWRRRPYGFKYKWEHWL